MSQLSLSLLGPFVASLDQQPMANFRAKSAQALLIYLVCQPAQSFSRDALTGLFWPELPQTAASKRLRDALYLLRRAIPAVSAKTATEEVPLLLTDRHTIQIHPAADYQLDIDTFAALLSGHIRRWPEAVALYRGDFLSDFYLPDSNAFEEWASSRRAALRHQMFQALEALTDWAIQGGDFSSAADYARRQLELDNLRESAHRQLMEALARNGRRRAAISQYELCCQLLQAELAIDPSAETKALFQAIQEEELGRRIGKPDGEDIRKQGQPVTPGLVKRLSGTRHNLPAQPTPFIGRERELAELQALLADPQTRLITVVGPGGIGKTRLALACAELVVNVQRVEPLHEESSPFAKPLPSVETLQTTPFQQLSFEHGVFFVDLAPVDDVEQMVPTLAQALDFPLQAGGQERRSPKQQFLDYLRRKQMLLILDNFEHLLCDAHLDLAVQPQDGADLVTGILEAAPEVQILVTSREQLQLRQEQVYPIQGLELPETLSVESSERAEIAAQCAAVRLFLQTARRNKPDFDLTTGDNLGYMVRVCCLVAGMPLAIELAAAWVDTLSLEAICVEIGQGIGLLESAMRDVPARHRSIQAAFDHTWGRLDETEQQVFLALSVFRGDFTRPAAQEVTGASLRLLSRLVNKSLLHYSEKRDRYRVHELLRQYAVEKLSANRAVEVAVRDNHSFYYCQALGQRENDLKGAKQWAAMAEITADTDNILAAWDWALEKMHLNALWQAHFSLFRFYWNRSRYTEGKKIFRRAADKLALLTDCDNLKIDQVGLLRLRTTFLAYQLEFDNPHGTDRRYGDEDLKYGLLKQRLPLLEELAAAGHETRSERASCLLLMATLTTDEAERKRLREESLALYREIGDQWWTAWALEHAAWPGIYDDVKRFLEESVAIRRVLGDRLGIAESIGTLAWNTIWQLRFEEADSMLREVLSIFQEMGDRARIALTLRGLDTFSIWQGKFADAYPLAEQYLSIYSELGSRMELAYSQALAGFAGLYLGRYEEARVQAQLGLTLCQEMNHKYGVAHSLDILGRIAMAKKAFNEAQERLQECLDRFDAIGVDNNVNQVHGCLGHVFRALEQPTQAQQQFYQALQGAAEAAMRIRAYLPLVHALPGIALLMADQGEPKRAVELYALASTQGIVANSQWFEDIAGRQIAAVANTLPPDVVAAAEARGRARDLWETAAELLAEFDERGWGEGLVLAS